MSRVSARIGIAETALMIFLCALPSNRATAADEQLCDVPADFALGIEDYPTAIVLHRRFLHSQSNNALAHYHLGFAYGMTGRGTEEISEYLTAIRLGLDKWDLFLNLGLAYFGQHEFAKAASA